MENTNIAAGLSRGVPKLDKKDISLAPAMTPVI